MPRHYSPVGEVPKVPNTSDTTKKVFQIQKKVIGCPPQLELSGATQGAIFVFVLGYIVLATLIYAFLIVPTRQLKGSAYNTAILDVPSLSIALLLVLWYTLSDYATSTLSVTMRVIGVAALSFAAMNAASAYTTIDLYRDCPGGFLPPANITSDNGGMPPANGTVVVDDLNQAQLYACNHQEYLLLGRATMSCMIGLLSLIVFFYAQFLASRVNRVITRYQNSRDKTPRESFYV